MKTILLFLFIALSFSLFAQAIDNTTIYRDMHSDKFVRFHYENDFFTATDIYYTQGIQLEIGNPAIKNFPLSRLLISPKSINTRYGIAVEHNGYTPTSIRHKELLDEDRPFTATLFFKTFAIAADSLKNRRISSSISLGIIGAGAGGKEVQESIHQWLNNIAPLGWQHQLKNDVILNYEVSLEKRLVDFKELFQINVNGGIRAGTLSDKASVGLLLMFGYFDNPYRTLIKKNYQLYVYASHMISLIGYDATLQGGLFNSSSPYVITADKIQRLTLLNNFGVVMRIKKLYLEYFQARLTKEFSTGVAHRWGGVRIGLSF